MRTAGWLLFSPLVVIMLIKKSVPEERLLNLKVLHIKKKNHILKYLAQKHLEDSRFLTLSTEKILYLSLVVFLLPITETICYA